MNNSFNKSSPNLRLSTIGGRIIGSSSEKSELRFILANKSDASFQDSVRHSRNISTNFEKKLQHGVTATDLEFNVPNRSDLISPLCRKEIPYISPNFEKTIFTDRTSNDFEPMVPDYIIYIANEFHEALGKNFFADGYTKFSDTAVFQLEDLTAPHARIGNDDSVQSSNELVDIREDFDNFSIPGKTLGATISLFALSMSIPTFFSNFYVLHPAVALALFISGVTFVAMSYVRKSQ